MDVEALTAKDVMTESVLTVRENLTLQEIAALLIENEITGAPVVDEAGGLLGVVSLTDVARILGTEEGLSGHAARPEIEVRQIMTPIADSVSEATPVTEIARIMVANHYHRLVVIRQETPVGIVSSMDLVRLIAELG